MARRHQPVAVPQLHRELFRAHFVPGEDLGDSGVIDRFASAAGIDLAALRTALDDGSTEEVASETETQGRSHGLAGAPAWLLDGRLIAGLRPAADIERLADRVGGFVR